MKTLIQIVLILTFATIAARAQYTIESSAINGGGGKSQGGRFTVEGTIGQPVVGISNGGRYQIDGGFWGGVQVVQVAGLPQLRIAKAGDTIVISWEDPENHFTLQESESMIASEWSITKRTIQSDGATRHVELIGINGYVFFRLSSQ
jgi:hypothetical protein